MGISFPGRSGPSSQKRWCSPGIQKCIELYDQFLGDQRLLPGEIENIDTSAHIEHSGGEETTDVHEGRFIGWETESARLSSPFRQ